MSNKDLGLTLPPELTDLPEEVRTLPDLVYRGLEQYREGNTLYLGSFAQYALSEPSQIQWESSEDFSELLEDLLDARNQESQQVIRLDVGALLEDPNVQ